MAAGLAVAAAHAKTRGRRNGRRTAVLPGWLLLASIAAGCGGADDQEHPGKAVYVRHCFACHQSGVAGAPKLGDKEEWAPRLAKGRDALVDNVIQGMTPGMPPRGACATCTDEALGLAVDYMLVDAQ